MGEYDGNRGRAMEPQSVGIAVFDRISAE